MSILTQTCFLAFATLTKVWTRGFLNQLKLLNYGSFEANDLPEGSGRAHLPKSTIRICGVLQREGLAGFLYDFLFDCGQA